MYSVLVVEDVGEILEPLLELLALDARCRGVVEVHGARSGEEGLEKFFRFHPCLVLTDVRMPGISGFELARRLRQVESAVRVVFTTGFAIDTALRQEAAAAGVDSFFRKPYDPNRLIELVLSVRGNRP